MPERTRPQDSLHTQFADEGQGLAQRRRRIRVDPVGAVAPISRQSPEGSNVRQQSAIRYYWIR